MTKIEAREAILRKVRETTFDLEKEISGKRLFGLHRSQTKGAGYDFLAHSPFEEGQERFVDWHAFGRTGEKFLKRFREEKDIPTLLLMDLTPTMFTGTNRFFEFLTTKSEAAFVTASSFHQRSLKMNDPVGCFLINPSSKVQLFEPKKGPDAHEGLERAWDIIWEHQPLKEGTKPGGFVGALGKLELLYDRPSLLVIISDLAETFRKEKMEEFRRVIRRLEYIHALALLLVRTPWEYGTPETDADIAFGFADTGYECFLSSPLEREIWRSACQENKRGLERFFEAMGVMHAFLETNDQIVRRLNERFSPTGF